MCPGLTHANVVGELKANPVPENTPVCILAEGKEMALAIGHTQVRDDKSKKLSVSRGRDGACHRARMGEWGFQG